MDNMIPVYRIEERDRLAKLPCDMADLYSAARGARNYEGRQKAVAKSLCTAISMNTPTQAAFLAAGLVLELKHRGENILTLLETLSDAAIEERVSARLNRKEQP